jgi:hypothetical protein
LALETAAGLIFLNGILNLEVFTGGLPWIALLRPAPECLGFLAVLGVAARRRTPPRPAAGIAVSVAFVLLAAFRLADAWVSVLFSRPLNLYLDAQRLPDLVLLAWTLLSTPGFALALAAGGLGLAGIGWGAWHSLRALGRAWSALNPGPATRWLTAAAGLAALGGAGLQASTPAFFAGPILPRLAQEARFILDLEGIRLRDLAAIRHAAERAGRGPTDLGRLDRAPVFLFVLESYGRAAFSEPGHARRIAPEIQGAERDLWEAGFSMCSSYLSAPTSGGRSWLSHATLASGVRVDGQIRHDLLLASDLAPLAEYFKRAGYRTVRAMPGTLWPWPAGEFYGYQRTYIAGDFGYRGPRFAWAPMPDQFVLDWVRRREIREESGPLFIEFIMVSSHADFEVHAPYLPAWRQIGDGSIFNTLPAVVFPGAWRSADTLSEAYSTAIIYEFTVLKEFIRASRTAGGLFLILGDHQPVGPVAGADRSASVPIHVISRNPEFIRRFMDRGYTAGLVPEHPLPHPGMETFFWDLLEGFSTR